MTAHRDLPHSDRAELNLLGACFIDGNDVVARCSLAGIRPDSFYTPAHGAVFGVMLDLFAAQKPISVEVVVQELIGRNMLSTVGGVPAVLEMSHAVPTSAEAAYFIESVREYAIRRAVIRACASAIESCHDSAADLDSVLGSVSDGVSRAIGGAQEGAEESFGTVAAALAEEAVKPKETASATGEVSWSLLDIDKACGLLCPGNLAVVAGMPSTGKSALADQLAMRSAFTGANVLIFSYEMTKREKAIRMSQQASGINFDKVHEAPTDLRRKFIASARAIADCNRLHVFERDNSVAKLTARVKAFSNRGNKVGLIVVDFLQYLARLEPTLGKERTDEKIGRITAALKALARECVCPVLLLSSLNRDGYKDGNRPTLASLRSSGEIESDADVVAILHWPKQNPITRQDQDPHDSLQSRFYVEFNQDKGRSKGVHQIGIIFDRMATRFENI